MMIISGGQTGVDRAALDAALDLGLPCGGYCPSGRKAEDGTIAEKYPLQCLASPHYKDRTLKNVISADGTLIIFNPPLAGGTRLTANMCRTHHKPFLAIDVDAQNLAHAVELAYEFIVTNQLDRVNIAGPRQSVWPEGYDYAHRLLTLVLPRLSSRTLNSS